MRKVAPWLWVNCENVKCRYRAPKTLTLLIIRWDGDASSDVLPPARAVLQLRPPGLFAYTPQLGGTRRWVRAVSCGADVADANEKSPRAAGKHQNFVRISACRCLDFRN